MDTKAVPLRTDWPELVLRIFLDEGARPGVGRLHVRYKIGAWLRGLIERPDMRAPMPRPRPEEIETMYRLMSKVGIPLMDKKDLKIAA